MIKEFFLPYYSRKSGDILKSIQEVSLLIRRLILIIFIYYLLFIFYVCILNKSINWQKNRIFWGFGRSDLRAGSLYGKYIHIC